jgi:glycosyltransferase involved in cell wall biosynthesis
MIILNMIVKDEVHVIERCIKSVLPFIDAAVIVDTGSTDDTQEQLAMLLHDLPHAVLSQDWVDFGYNRTQAFWKAVDYAGPKRPGYALIIDADEELLPCPGFTFDGMPVCDGYAIWQAQGASKFLQPRLLNLGAPWVYQGMVHEVAECLGGNGTRGILNTCTITGHFDSARNKKGAQKYLDDAAVMETMPETPRNVFYKAQCYRNAGHLETALGLYERRSVMGDFVEDVYLSLLFIAQIKRLLNYAPFSVATAFVMAYDFRPSLEETNHHEMVYFSTLAASIPMTTDQQGVDLRCYSVK